jgi:hypothetical protein
LLYGETLIAEVAAVISDAERQLRIPRQADEDDTEVFLFLAPRELGG